MKNVTVELWNRALTYQYPNIDAEIEQLKYSSILYGGFATCSFNVPTRDPKLFYPDLQPANVVKIRHDGLIVWEGLIVAPGLDIAAESALAIQAAGFVYRLKRRWSTASFGASVKGSTWITNNLIADTDLGLTAATIQTGDYAFPNGLDLAPQAYYSDVLERVNAANGWHYGVWENRTFDFKAVSTSPDYYIDIEDCDSQIVPALDAIENYLRVSYTTDGSTYKYFNWPATGPDATSAALYGRCDGTLAIPGKATLAQAQQIATVALNERKVMRPATAIVARRVLSSTGVEVPLEQVNARGKLVHIRGLYPGELTIENAQAINELSTFVVVHAEPDLEAGTVTLSPGTYGLQLDKRLARLEAKAK